MASTTAADLSADEDGAPDIPLQRPGKKLVTRTFFTCEICFDDEVPEDSAMTICGSGHRFCSECCFRCVQSSVGDGLVPACPKEKEAKCGTVGKATAEAALTCWLRDKKEAQTRKAELVAAGWAVRGSSSAGYISGKLNEVYLSSERARQGAVQCIGKGCRAFYVPPVPHSTAPQRLVCTIAKCGASFCAACRMPYHFRSSCAEATRIQARWLRFLQTELSDFLKAAVQVEPERYAPILKEHTRAKGALDEATKDALSRFEELRKMEQWKEKHCRHCPHCGRVVEKMSGCDQMRCGHDAHGGNEQRGCGKTFDWRKARVYAADLRSAADDGDGKEEHAKERRLQLDAKEEHLLVAGAPVLCDGCGNPIIGPRLQCVQCAGCVDLCIGCVGKAARTKPLLLRDGTKHPKQHTFRRIRQPPNPNRHAPAIDLAPSTVDLGASAPPTSSSRKRPIDLTGAGQGVRGSRDPQSVDLTGDDQSGGGSSSSSRNRHRPVDLTSGQGSSSGQCKRPTAGHGAVDLTGSDSMANEVVCLE